MAALLAMGMNIGLIKMTIATPGLIFKQLANVSQWRMNERNHYEDVFRLAHSLNKEEASVEFYILCKILFI